MSSGTDEDDKEDEAAGGKFTAELPIGRDRIPIVYRPEYGVRFLGLQKLHPFDAAKGGNIYRLLKTNGLIQTDGDVYAPNEITLEELLAVHTQRYIDSLKVRHKEREREPNGGKL